MEHRGQGVLRDAVQREAAQEVGHLRLAHGNNEVLEVHRPEVHVLHAPDRHREAGLRERKFQQRAGGQHVQLGHLLVEVPQRRERFGCGLDLVQEEEVGSRRRRFPGQQLEQRQNACRIPVAEGFPQFGVAFEVDRHQGQSRGAGELAHQGGLAYLPRAANDDRLVGPARRPGLQITDLATLEYLWHEPVLTE